MNKKNKKRILFVFMFLFLAMFLVIWIKLYYVYDHINNPPTGVFPIEEREKFSKYLKN